MSEACDLVKGLLVAALKAHGAMLKAPTVRSGAFSENERNVARDAILDLVAKMERERDEALAKLDAAGGVLGTVIVAGTLRPGETMRLDGDHAAIDALRGLLARLARYEAPGPAALKAEHAEDCYVAFRARAGREPFDEFTEEGACDCGRSMREQAYREQHARDVAVVEAVDIMQVTPVANPAVSSHTLAAIAKGAILRALKGER